MRYDGQRLGIVTGDGEGIIDITDRLRLSSKDPLKEYIEGGLNAAEYESEEPDVSVADVRVESPIATPGKIVAAARNYAEHIGEMKEMVHSRGDQTVWDSGYFLKAPSSIIGPNDDIVLPYTDRRFDHELELAFVMRDSVKDIEPEEVWNSILGYTILLDISMRGDEDRPRRKSFDSFTVVGPVLATADQIEDPQALDMELRVNGTLRQEGNTDQMIANCADFVSYASDGTTIKSGDLITTGTPSGVGPLSDGDIVDARIEDIGEISVGVRQRDVRFSDRRNR